MTVATDHISSRMETSVRASMNRRFEKCHPVSIEAVAVGVSTTTVLWSAVGVGST